MKNRCWVWTFFGEVIPLC